jgi:putative Mg2+ transporter-C (MgtC) family protein
MDLPIEQFALRLLAALVLGALVGLERQWRQRASGLRTNALVAVGAALFVLLSVAFAEAEASPTRVAAQVVSGIGFLGAGVILRDGVTVRGVNTAATIWCAAAIGSLSAAGMVDVAAMGAVAVVFINLALRPIARAIERQPADADTEVEARYRFRATCREDQEGHVRVLTVQALAGGGFTLRTVESRDVAPRSRGDGADGPPMVEVRAELTTSGRDDARLEQAVNRLSLEPGVTSVRWDVTTDDED